MHRPLVFATIGMALLFAAIPKAFSQNSGLKDQLVGTWMLVSIIGERDGKQLEPWGASPQGILVLNTNGRFAQIQMRSDMPKWASNNRTKGTPEELRATAVGTLTYYGKYSVDGAGKVLLFTLEASSFPNFNGSQNKRPFELNGDELVTMNPAAAGGSPIRLIWRRDR